MLTNHPGLILTVVDTKEVYFICVHFIMLACMK